jgi:phage major head subunit gpT-like protein
MALITNALITALFQGFRGEFQAALTATPTDWDKVATMVPSTTAGNTYGWLGQFPKLREWIGPRVVKDMQADAYQILNKTFEATVGVKRTDIEDDNLGIYRPLFAEMGRAAASHPDELIFALLAAGGSTLCYDGQNFFDTDHPVYANADGTGAVTATSNVNTSGTGPNWYLLDVSRALKPLILQVRAAADLQAMTDRNDEGVFTNDEYRYGIRARHNAGFGFWQMAYRSNEALTPATYGAARAAMRGFKADGGRPLGIRPNLLVVPSSLEATARKLLVKDENGGNEWAGSAELLVSDWI